jgi:hypothetical protein
MLAAAGASLRSVAPAIHRANEFTWGPILEVAALFIGIFLTMIALTWLKCGSVIRTAKRQPDGLWARDLAAMIQVSLVAYAAAGAFLGLAYFDYLYHLVAIVVVLHTMYPGRAAKAAAPRPAAGAAPRLTIGTAIARLRGE